METNKILQADYLDLIFDKRNKVYGGYELRKHYNQRALRALGITLTVLLLGVGTPFVWSKLHAKETSLAMTNVPNEVNISDVFIPPPPEPVPPLPEPANAAPARTARTEIFTPPVIVPPNVKPDMDPPDMKKLETALAGPVKSEGEGGNVAATSTDKNNGPFGNGTETVGKTGGSGIAPASNEPVKFAEEMPDYPGGMAALLAFIQKNLHYPAIAREDGIEGRVIVSFIVNTAGEIEGAKVVKSIGGGCDKEALRVVNAMPKWKPGKQNGHLVKVYYTLPISFKLQ
jgi:protein TonB